VTCCQTVTRHLLAALLLWPAAASAQNKWLAPLPFEAPVRADERAEVAVASGRERRQLMGMIRAGERAGQLSRAEAKNLRRDVRGTGVATARLGSGGFTGAERREFGARWHVVRDRIVAARTRGIGGR